MKTDATRRSELLARRTELDTRLHAIEHDLEEPVDKDIEDQAVELEGDEVLESLGAQGLREIRMIDAALKRLDAGEYGFCTKCGVRVSEQRLDLLPHTPFCRNCAI